MSNLQKGTRAMLIGNGPNVSKGTIGTIEDIQNEIAIVRYSFDEERNQSLFVGVPLSLLAEVTQNDLQGIDYKILVDHIYHIGKVWRTNLSFSLNESSEEQIVSIEDVKLAPYSKDDLFRVKVMNSSISEYHEIKRSVIDNYFIVYNPLLEESLAEEILDGGEGFEPCPGFRVFIKDMEKVAVLMESDDTTRVVRLKYYETGVEVFKDTAIENIRPATQDEINSTPYYQIVDKIFRVGMFYKAKPEVKNVVEINKYIKPGSIFSLTDVDVVAQHVLDDKFTVYSDTGAGFSLSTYYLYTYFTAYDPESESQKIDSQVTQDDTIKIDNISINNFRFSITQNGNIINKRDINLNELDAYINALQQLQEITKI